MTTLIQQRRRRIGQAAGVSLACQLVSIVISIVLVPILLSKLGASGYGLYATLMTFPSLLAAADFGIGTAVISRVSASMTVNDYRQAQVVVSNSLAVLCMAGLMVLGLGALAVPIGVAKFSAKSADFGSHDILVSLCILVTAIAIGIPCALGGRVAMGLQRGWLPGVQSAISSILLLILVLTIFPLKPSLPIAMVLALGSATAAGAGLTVWILRTTPTVRPSRRLITANEMSRVVRAGGLFLCLSLASAISFQADTLIVSLALSPDKAAIYAVYARLFQLGPMMVGFVLTPMWPAFSEAIAAGDHDWLVRTFKRSMVMGLAVNTAWACLCIAAGPAIIWVWTDGTLTRDAPWGLIAALALWTAMNGIVGPLAVILNSAHIVRPQVLGASLMAAVNITASLYLVNQIGVSGPVWGSLLGQVTCMIPFSVFAARKLISYWDLESV